MAFGITDPAQVPVLPSAGLVNLSKYLNFLICYTGIRTEIIHMTYSAMDPLQSIQ